MMEGRGVKGHESISAYVRAVLPNCPSVSLNRRGRVVEGGTSLLLPVSLRIETYQPRLGSRAAPAHTGGRGMLSLRGRAKFYHLRCFTGGTIRAEGGVCSQPCRSGSAADWLHSTREGGGEAAHFLPLVYLELFAVLSSRTLAPFSNNLKFKLPVGFSRP